MELILRQPGPILLIAALAGWTAIMVQRGIAVFHDGLRQRLGDFVEGQVQRADVIDTSGKLNQLFMVFFIPLTLATGIILAHILLLPLDLLGIRSRRWWHAGLAGVIWGACLAVAVPASRLLLAELPIDIPAVLLRSLDPLIFGMAIVPTVAAATQFGTAAGLWSLVLMTAGYLIEQLTTVPATNTLPLLASLMVLAVLTVRAERERRAAGEETLDMGFLQTKSHIVRRNGLWFVIQGGLLGAAVNMALFSWFVYDMAAFSSGFRLQAALAAVTITVGFLPTVVTSAVMTGVSQVVGLTFVFAAAYLSPNFLVAAAAGAVIMLLESRLLGRINQFMNDAPTVREVGDSMRGAIDQVGGLLLIAGAFLASDSLMPGGGGYLILAGIIGLNEVIGTPIMRLAVGPVALLIVATVANLLYPLGLV